MDAKIYDILDDIVNEFLNSKEVKEYISLNEFVRDNYSEEILYFITTRDQLEEQKKYNLDIEKYEKRLVIAKEKLYSISEVKRIKELEHLIQKELDTMTNELSSFISNKIKKKRVI